MNKKKFIVGIAALVVAVALVIALSIGSLGFTNWNVKTWFNGWGKGLGGEVTVEGAESPMLVTAGEANGVLMDCRILSLAEYDEYGIDTQAESAYTITATIKPVAADDKRVEWSVAPKSGNTNATDYITLTQNGLSATVACKQAFDVQFIVTCKSLDNPNAKATCVLDYVQRVTGVTVNMPKLNSQTAEVTYTTQSSKYTIPSNIGVTFSNFVFNADFGGEFSADIGDGGLPVNAFLWLHPTYTNQLVQYTSTGLKFLHGGSIAADSQCDVCVDGLIGCICAISGQYLDYFDYDEGDIIAGFRMASEEYALGTVDITVSSTYGGKTYNSLTKSVEIWVDGASVHVPVTGLSLDKDSLLM